MEPFTERRILIWGKTHPELSHKFLEGAGIYGVLEDGRPVRLNPVEFRHLEGVSRLEKHQWVRARIPKNEEDPRPESYRVESGSMQPDEQSPPTADEFEQRTALVFQEPRWQFATMADLGGAQRRDGTSLGVVAPGAIKAIELDVRSNDQAGTYEDRLARLAPRVAALEQQGIAFDLADAVPHELLSLPFPMERIRVRWQCSDKTACPVEHSTSFLDWELQAVLQEEGPEKALQRARDLLDVRAHDVRLFLGNFASHPSTFGIVGTWQLPTSSSSRGR